MKKTLSKPHREEGKQGIQVIARSASIMRVLSRNPQGLSLSAIADRVMLPRSTVQRIIYALQDEYFVEAVGSGGGFKLGPAIGRLLYQTQADIISVVHPYLEQLCVQFEESSYLSGQLGNEVTSLDRVIAEQALRIVFPVGATAPMYSTAAGKALLANFPARQVETLLPSRIPSETVNTLDRTRLLKQLEEIQYSGIATDNEEQMLGVCSLAAPLKTYLGIFAIGVVLPRPRLADKESAIREALLNCKENIEARIGDCVVESKQSRSGLDSQLPAS